MIIPIVPGIQTCVQYELEAVTNARRVGDRYYVTGFSRIGTPGGEYRAIYQLIPEDHVILIVLIASREGVYKILGRLGLD